MIGAYGRPIAPNSWPRWPSSWKPMSGQRPADRSTSTPGWPPTHCASSSANCSTKVKQKAVRRWPAWVSPTRKSSPPPSGRARSTVAPDRGHRLPARTWWTPVGRCPSRIRPRIGAAPRCPPVVPQTIVDVADRLFTAIQKSDVAAVDRLWSDDIAVWRVGCPPRRRQGPRAAGYRLVHRCDHRASLRDSRPSALRRWIRRMLRMLRIFQWLRPAAHPARHRPCRPIDLDAGLHRDQGGRTRPDRPDRRVLRPRRDRAVDRLAWANRRE